ncbi:MAG TPA: tetratricopeptide repeat protein [Terriglobales bacterium]|nr:tetratricopeptide repeat protein [Terriglobales bacterium]
MRQALLIAGVVFGSLSLSAQNVSLTLEKCKVLDTERNNLTALSECANLLESSGRWHEAVTLLTRLTELQPNNADALYRLGRMKSWMEGGATEATILLKRASDADPGNPDYKVAYAEVLSRKAQHLEEAVQILQPVVAEHPDHVEARRLVARLLGEEHKNEEALRILQPLLARANPELEDYETQAEIEETAGNMRGAAAAYRNILRIKPDDVPTITKLAQVLSWNDPTRTESIQLFERGLKLDPGNLPLTISYAEMLSWTEGTRIRAMQLFDSVLAHDPDNVRALTGKAELLAWSGHSQAALALYDRALAKDPKDGDALRGKAEVLNWRGSYAQAQALLERAHEIAPDDARTNLEMARSDVGLHRYADARSELGMIQGLQGAELTEVSQDVNRGLGTYVELGYIGRRNRQQLDFNRLDALVSTPLNSSNRLTFDYTPTLYSTIVGDFNSNRIGVALDSEPSERLNTHAEFSGIQYPGQPPEWNTALNLHYKLRDSLTLVSGFQRQPVEETFLSTRGLDIGSLFTGEVQSNLASAAMNYSNSAHHFDASLTSTGGVYTGHNLDSNRVWGFDFNLGKSIRGDKPYIRIAYGASYLSFDHDADFQPNQGFASQITGGYYSPTKFLLNYGGVNASHKFGRKLEWDAAATAGVQNAQTTFTEFSNPHFASTFATHAVWHVSATNDIRAGYDYLNVFNAFHRHLFSFSWRHYF